MGNGCGAKMLKEPRVSLEAAPAAAGVEALKPDDATPDSGSGSSSASTAAHDDSERGVAVGQAAEPAGPLVEVFTPEERAAAWCRAGKDNATCGHERPVALWIIGPSAVGKSTIAHELGPEFDVPPTKSRLAGSRRGHGHDAVLVDGEFFREVHSTYQEWAKSACWVDAYPKLKPVINKEKQEMLEAAARGRQHLVLPQTCMNLPKCLGTMADLARSGYTNHILAVTAPRDEVARRGLAREVEEGKRYAPEEYDRSVAAFGPLIAACNGRYQVVRAVEPPLDSAEEGRRTLLREVLASGAGGPDVVLPEALCS